MFFARCFCCEWTCEKKLFKINKNNVTIFNEKKVTNYLHYGDNYIIEHSNKKQYLSLNQFPYFKILSIVNYRFNDNEASVLQNKEKQSFIKKSAPKKNFLVSEETGLNLQNARVRIDTVKGRSLNRPDS